MTPKFLGVRFCQIIIPPFFLPPPLANVCVCMCECVRECVCERERVCVCFVLKRKVRIFFHRTERDKGQTELMIHRSSFPVCVRVRVCVCVRESVCVWVCVCVRERQTDWQKESVCVSYSAFDFPNIKIVDFHQVWLWHNNLAR